MFDILEQHLRILRHWISRDYRQTNDLVHYDLAHVQRDQSYQVEEAALGVVQEVGKTCSCLAIHSLSVLFSIGGQAAEVDPMFDDNLYPDLIESACILLGNITTSRK